MTGFVDPRGSSANPSVYRAAGLGVDQVAQESALAPETKRWTLGTIGYALFAPAATWKGNTTVAAALGSASIAELLPGGEFATRIQDWLAEESIQTRMIARMPSFTRLARLVKESGVAAVLPEIAKVDFVGTGITAKPMPWKHSRKIALIANSRSLDRSGIGSDVADELAKQLSLFAK